MIVTGGAGGIGSAICARFVVEGSRVAATDLVANAEVSEKAYAVEIADQARVNAVMAEVERDVWPVDALVDNASWDRAASYLENCRGGRPARRIRLSRGTGG